MALSKEVLDEFGNTKLFMLSTASKDGIPNVVPVAMVILQDDNETIWIVDNFMCKTLANLKENPVASLLICNQGSPDSYQLKGKVTIESSGADYEVARDIAHKRKETLPAKNLVKLRIEKEYYVTPGPKAGKKVTF